MQHQKEVYMVKEKHHHKDMRKKPTMTLKERRQKKHEKKQSQHIQHLIEDHPMES